MHESLEPSPRIGPAKSFPLASLLAPAIGFAPVILFLTTMGQDISAFQFILKTLAIPVLIVEIGVSLSLLGRAGHIPVPPRWISISMAALMLLAVATSLNAKDPSISIIKISILFIHLGFGIAIYLIYARSRMFYTEILYKNMTVGFLIFTILSISYALLHREDDYVWAYYFPAYNQIRGYGYYAAAIAGLCLWKWIAGDKISGVVAAFALAAALWTGSRGTLAAVAGGYAGAFLLFPFARRGILRFLAVLGAGILLSVALTVLVPLGRFGPQRLIGDDSDSGRIAIWGRTLEMALQRPWFGWGESQFATLFPDTHVAQPHNVFLQILLSWGFVGAGLVAILSIWLGCKVYRAVNEQNAAFLLAAMNIAVFSLFDGSLYHVQSVSIFALCIAVVLATKSGDAAGGCRVLQPG